MSWKEYNKKQNEYFNRILDLLMDETIISGSELKFPFLSQGTKSKDLYNQFFPHPSKYTHFINNPISPNLTTMSYKIGEYMKEVYGVTDEEVGFLWDLYRERVKSKLNKFREKPLPDRVFQIIQDDLFERTVKLPRTNTPLCTGGESVDYRDFDDTVNVSANQEGVYDQPNFVIQLNLPSSEFPYNVEMGRGRSWGQLNDYLKQQYGLTDEECQQVWDEYRGTICKNAKLPFVNESKSFNTTHFNFLEKVSQTMADNTPIYYKEDALHVEFPYFNIPTHETYRAPKSKWGTETGKLRHYDTQIQSVKEIITGLWPSIGGKIMNIFGLTHDEADLIYPWYQSLIHRKVEEVLSPIFEIEPLTRPRKDHYIYESEKKLNKSRDKQQELIQYVITTLLNETIIDKENSEVILPWNMKYVNIMANFAGIDKDLHNPALELNGSMAYNFWDMMESIYGLTDDEVERVWKIYGPTLSQRMHDVWFDDWKTQYYGGTILDESEVKIITHPEDDEDPYSFAWHPEPKKRKFYEAVLRDVVNDSTIEPDGVISVGDTKLSHQKGLLFHNLSHSYDVGPFLKHLRDTYGLVRHETHPIWSRWEHIMTDKIKKWLTAKGIKLTDAGYEEPLWAQNDEEEINESKDKKKAKQQKVLDYAIEDLTNNTSLDWGYNEYHNDGNSYQIIRFPFSIYPHEDPTNNRLEWIMIDPHYNLDIAQFYTQFKPYARMMYGLTDVELLKVFADWEEYLIEKIRDHSETDPPH